MSVTGYLDLYTTLLGWSEYDRLWHIMVGTGLIYLPFLSILVSATLPSFLSSSIADAAQSALKQLLLRLITVLLILAFAGVPLVHLNPKVLHFKPICQLQSVTSGHSGTTYDSAFQNASAVATGADIPILWYLVMAVSNGITQAAIQGLPCLPLNYRQLHSELNTASIQDPRLKEEVNHFYEQCYIPSYSKYLRHSLSIKPTDAEDLVWIGSSVFSKESGYYDTLKATQPIEGFIYQEKRDFEQGQVGTPQWGTPTCKSWWEDPKIGLHVRLQKALPSTVLQVILQKTQPAAQQALQDEAIKTLIKQSDPTSWTESLRGYASYNDRQHWSISNMSSGINAHLGVRLHTIDYFPRLELLRNSLPVIEASLLFAFYALLALALPFSSYRLDFCITASIMLFSLIFVSYLWHLVEWLDALLIQAIYPPLHTIPGMGGVLSFLGHVTMDKTFVDMVIYLLYLVLPLFWLIVMSWAGIQVGMAVGGFFAAMSEPAQAAGGAVGGLARGVLNQAISKTIFGKLKGNRGEDL